MYSFLIVAGFVAVIFFLIQIARVIIAELQDRQIGASNQSGNVLIVILVICGLGGILVLVFSLLYFLRHA